MKQSLRSSKRSLVPPTQTKKPATVSDDRVDKQPGKKAPRAKPREVKAAASATANFHQNSPWAKVRNALKSTSNHGNKDGDGDDSISNDAIFDHPQAVHPSSQGQQEEVESNPVEAFG